MNEIIIDTSFSVVNLALKKQDKKIYLKKNIILNKQAENLAYELKELLKDSDLETKDINQIYCIVGPGSWTGIRVAIALIKGLMLVHKNIKVLSISSFMLYAIYVKNIKQKNINILIDCGKNKEEFFYLKLNNKFKKLTKERVVSYQEVLSKDFFSQDEIIVGNFPIDFFVNNNNATNVNYQELELDKIFSYDLMAEEKLTPLYVKGVYNL